MDSVDYASIYATAHYLKGYVSVAHADDDHLNEWADRLIQMIEAADPSSDESPEDALERIREQREARRYEEIADVRVDDVDLEPYHLKEGDGGPNE